MAVFVKDIEGVCSEYFAADTRARSLDLVVLLRPPHRARVWFVPEPTAAECDAYAALSDRILAIPAPSVTGPVAVALCGAVGGYERPASDPQIFRPPMPAAWLEAMERRGGGVVPDDILDAVWPDEH